MRKKKALKSNAQPHFSFLHLHFSFLITHFSFAILISHFTCLFSHAQTSDSLIVSQLRDYGIEFSDDNSVTLLMSGQEKFDDMFTAIRQAKHSVHLEYFNFRNDSIASLLFDILREKRREGVEVRAMFDGFGNDSNNQPLLKRHIRSLRADSIDIYEYDPIRFPWVNHIWPRDHRKIVVIEGVVAYTGGMNVGSWRDMHCRIEGKAVNQLQDIFVKIWKEVSGEDLSGRTEYFRGGEESGFTGMKADTTQTTGHKMVGIINREPHTTNDVMRFFYISALDAAKDSVRIINPYFTLVPSVKKAIHRALERGVKVEVMLSAKSDIPLTPDCCFFNAHKLMKRGAHVWLYQPGFHHSKIMMVDGRFCTVGSANLDARSMRFDYEENAVIVDSCTTKQLDSMFDDDKRESIYLTPESWNSFRTPWQKFRGWFAHLLSPFL